MNSIATEEHFSRRTQPDPTVHQLILDSDLLDEASRTWPAEGVYLEDRLDFGKITPKEIQAIVATPEWRVVIHGIEQSSDHPEVRREAWLTAVETAVAYYRLAKADLPKAA